MHLPHHSLPNTRVQAKPVYLIFLSLTPVSSSDKRKVVEWKFNYYDKDGNDYLTSNERLHFYAEIGSFYNCNMFFNHVNDLINENSTESSTILRSEWEDFFGGKFSLEARYKNILLVNTELLLIKVLPCSPQLTIRKRTVATLIWGATFWISVPEEALQTSSDDTKRSRDFSTH